MIFKKKGSRAQQVDIATDHVLLAADVLRGLIDLGQDPDTGDHLCLADVEWRSISLRPRPSTSGAFSCPGRLRCFNLLWERRTARGGQPRRRAKWSNVSLPEGRPS